MRILILFVVFVIGAGFAGADELKNYLFDMGAVDSNKTTWHCDTYLLD